MPPSSSQEPPRQKFCAIGSHQLKQPSRVIQDPYMFKFAKMINPDIRTESRMCAECYNNLKKLYKVKMEHARRHQQRREESGTSISDVSNSQRQDSRHDSRGAASPASSHTSSDNIPTTSAAAAAKKRRPNEDVPSPLATRSNSYDSDDDDPNSNLSLNAVNGTRLPHIQPIPKRREFVHINKKAMDIYLAGTTGG